MITDNLCCIFNVLFLDSDQVVFQIIDRHDMSPATQDARDCHIQAGQFGESSGMSSGRDGPYGLRVRPV